MSSGERFSNWNRLNKTLPLETGGQIHTHTCSGRNHGETHQYHPWCQSTGTYPASSIPPRTCGKVRQVVMQQENCVRGCGYLINPDLLTFPKGGGGICSDAICPHPHSFPHLPAILVTTIRRNCSSHHQGDCNHSNDMIWWARQCPTWL
jgi:hypothetical protein